MKQVHWKAFFDRASKHWIGEVKFTVSAASRAELLAAIGETMHSYLRDATIRRRCAYPRRD